MPRGPKIKGGGLLDPLTKKKPLIICEKYWDAALDHIIRYHHVNFGDNWTHSLGARASAVNHEC